MSRQGQTNLQLIPLGASVSSKLKANHEFIDLTSLLDNREEPLSITISTGVINLHQGQKSKYPIPLSLWTDAFLIFPAIYLVNYLGSKFIKILSYDQGDAVFTRG